MPTPDEPLAARRTKRPVIGRVSHFSRHPERSRRTSCRAATFVTFRHPEGTSCRGNLRPSPQRTFVHHFEPSREISRWNQRAEFLTFTLTADLSPNPRKGELIPSRNRFVTERTSSFIAPTDSPLPILGEGSGMRVKRRSVTPLRKVLPCGKRPPTPTLPPCAGGGRRRSPSSCSLRLIGSVRLATSDSCP
jgi:hypothetical protein